MLSFVAYFETLLQLSLHLCQFTCTLWNFGKNNFFIIFLKNAYAAFFSILKRSYLWKMRGYPQFYFWISIAADMIYLSHIVITWEKYFPLVGTVLNNLWSKPCPIYLSSLHAWICLPLTTLIFTSKFNVSSKDISNLINNFGNVFCTEL